MPRFGIRGRRFIVAPLAVASIGMAAAIAYGDQLVNNLDSSIDANREVLALQVGGSNGTVPLRVQTQDGDGKNGCNLQGNTASVTFSVTSSNTAVASVSPSSVTINNCGDTPSVTVTPVGAGNADVTFAETANTSSGSWVTNTADFAVSVTSQQAQNNAPTVSTAAADATGNEGGTLTTSGAFADQDGDALTVTKVSGAGTVTQGAGGAWSWSLPTTDNGSGTVVVQAADGNGGTVTDTFDWSAANVAPTVTSVTPSVSNAVTGQSVAFTGAATDPSSADTAAGFTWSLDLEAFDVNGQTRSFSTCGSHTVSARARDKDGGISPAVTSSSVAVIDATIGSPLRAQNVINAVKRGQTVPVKVALGCESTPATGLAPSIKLASGDASSTADSGDPTEVVTASSSSADTLGVMRETETPGSYIYNMKMPTTDGLYTVIIRPYGTVAAGSARTALIQVRK